MILTPRPVSTGAGEAAAARFTFFRFLGFILLLFAAAPAGAAELHGRVIGIADGDTLTVLGRDRIEHRVRLSGIDAPERRQAFGERAKQHLAAQVFGKDVVVVWHRRDRYGRIVGKVLAPDCEHNACAKTLDAGLALIAAGLAWHYKQYEKEQKAADRVRYAAAEEAARRTHAGLWRDASPVPPWNFRRGSGSVQASPNPRPL
jgi:endonuclease YncB( thermonuclease family)